MDFLKSTTLAIGFCLFSVGNAFALPVTFNANSTYNTTPDSVYVVFIDRLNNNGDVVDKLRIDLNLNGTFATGNLNSNVFNTVTLNSTLASTTATDLDTNTSLQVALTGNLSFGYQNVLRNNDGSAMAQVGSTAGQNGLVLNLTGTLDNKTFSTTIPIGAMAATKDSSELSGYFSSLNNSFGNLDGANDGKVTFSLGSWAYNNDYSALIAWHGAKNASATYDGQAFNFNFSSDIHGRLDQTQVPEPATMGLLISGLIGGAARRRRKNS